MYKQLLNLYTINEHLQHPQKIHISVYIAPNGMIFDCKQNGVISHSTFSEEFYKNYSKLMTIHKGIDFATEVSEFILDDGNFDINDVRQFYLEQFDYVQYADDNLYNMVKNNYLSIENILVHDLGFVKVSINRGEAPAIELPMPIFNGKKLTAVQYDSLIKVLENNTISSQNYEPKRLVKLKEKDVAIKNSKLEELKVLALQN